MAIDFNSLLGVAPGIQTARQVFEALGDGPEIGRHNFRGTPVPAGAIVVGFIWATSIDITFDGSGTLTVELNAHPLVGPSLTSPVTLVELGSDPLIPITQKPTLLQAVVADAALLTGLVTVWLLYLPDTTIED